MEEKKVNKFLRRQFSAICWILIGYNVLMNVLVSVSIGLDAISQSIAAVLHGEFLQLDLGGLMNNAWGYILSIAVAMVVLLAWKDADYWKQEVFRKEKTMSAGIFFCLMSLCIGSQMVNSLWITLLESLLNRFGISLMQMLETVSGDTGSFSMFLYASLLAPFFEEILFRGLVLRTLRPFGKRFAIFGSALLFGLFHGNLLQTPYAFLMGLVLGYVTMEYSILWAMALHLFNNLVLADLLTRLTKNWPMLAQNAINLLIFGGFALVSLAILISRRQEIRAYRQAEAMDGRCMKWFFLNCGFLVLAIFMLVNMVALLFA